MREQFNRQISGLRQELIAILADVDLEIHDAVDALVDGDRAKAKRVKKATRSIDQRCADLEDQAYNMIVLQQPVASDLRLLQFIIFANFDVARMSNHAREIAKAVKHCQGRAVPDQFIDLIASQAHLVYRVLGVLTEAIVESDLGLAASLPALDAPVMALYKQFFRAFSQMPMDADRDATMRLVMSARMLGRISDNALEIGGRLVFLLTGRRTPLEDLAVLSQPELQKLYVARGEGLTFGLDEDARLAEQIPEVEITSTHPGTSSSVIPPSPDDQPVAPDSPPPAKDEGPSSEEDGVKEAAPDGRSE